MFDKLTFIALIKPFLYGVLLVTIGGCGGGSKANEPSGVKQPSDTTTTGSTTTADTPSLILLSGAPGGVGNADGIGGRLMTPREIAFDNAGNLLVYDGGLSTDFGSTSQFRAIRRVEMLSKPKLSTLYRFGGFGSDTGSLTVGPDGTIFMTHTQSSVISRILPSGEEIGFVGAYPPGATDGSVLSASFSFPDSIVADMRGMIYVADTGNGTIRMVTPDGTTSTLAGSAGNHDIVDGTGSNARFKAPVGITRDKDGNLYVGDENTIRRISPSGVVRTIAGSPGEAGSTDGTGSAARFGKPTSLTIDKAGNIFVADSGNFTIRRVTQGGVVTTITSIIGKGDDAGNPKLVDANYLARGIGNLAIDKSDNVFFADTNNAVIRKMTPDGTLSTVAGMREHPGNQDGPANLARFAEPEGSMAADSAGNVYVSANRTIRKIAPDGSATSLINQADPTTKEIAVNMFMLAGPYFPAAIPRDGSVYTFDWGRLYKIAVDGTKTFIAGGTYAPKDGTGTAAGFNSPTNLTVDDSGNVYLLNKETPTCCASHGFPYFLDGEWQSIRKVTPAGVVSTIAGCTTSKHCVSTLPFKISTFATDKHGDIYITDSASVRKISADGTMRTLQINCPGRTCFFGNIEVLAVGSDDTVYVADNGLHTISKIAPNGTVSLLAGQPGVQGAISGPLPASLGPVVAMTVGADNTLFVMMENAIFKIK